jgi:HD-GYP domain-containing protein (c-di-GMP phosphodiesterase class II)
VVNDEYMEAWFSRVEPVLGAALERRDVHTSTHCGRVGRLALAFAGDLGLAGEELLVLDVAARFHDVGKIGVPDAILHKQGALNDAEWEIMKGHSLHGEHIVRMDPGLPFGDEIALAVRHHHEHYDGTGYPDGLRGHAIPLPSRVLSVIDSYDAIRKRRAYHAAHSHESTVAILASERGTKHDPQILDAFLSHDRHWFDRPGMSG